MIDTVLLDMDGVLVDWIQGCLNIHRNEQTVEEVYANAFGEWDIRKLIQVSGFWEAFEEEFWAELPWMHDGRQILDIVESKFGRENIVICTSPTFNYGCWSGKRKWIERHLPKHYHSVRNQMFCSRKELAASPKTLLVDDSDANVDAFRKRGGYAVQVPRIWNRMHSLRGNSASVLQDQIIQKVS